MLDRRQFTRALASAALVGLVDLPVAARVLGRDSKWLSWRAHRTPTGAPLFRTLKDVEGGIPDDLQGTLYRTAAGESERFGVPLRHFFDGDAFLSGWSFRDGSVTLSARFLDQPERVEEQKAGRMLFDEFGTRAPESRGRSKNQPSINVLPWRGQLLGLTEGHHPVAIDPTTLRWKGTFDFGGQLPPNQSFTAHPKVDPQSGVGYGYGIVKGRGLALRIQRMETDGSLTVLHELPQRGFFMIHDVALAGDHLVFVIPPVSFDLRVLMRGGHTVAESLRFAEDQPTRIVIVRKDGQGKPVEAQLPASMVFHHGNAFERDGRLVLDTFIGGDGAILRQLHAWSKDELPEATPIAPTRVEIELETGEVASRQAFGGDEEFPRFDERRSGTDVRHLFTLGRAPLHDPFAFRALIRHDRAAGTSQVREVEPHQVLGEPVFVARSDDEAGWILQLGYDGRRDETFLDVLDAASLDRLARAWAGTHLPLGLHGNFTTDHAVAKEG